jgi:alkylation response protein AidB-like acyl-CoA dehydrogenase/crotonobetainyl-CoA:carnitine CoA-transferase CaiB-like acyl-CoA transferase
MTATELDTLENDQLILDMLDRFLETEVRPYVHKFDHDDIYPAEIVEKMKEMGLFGCIIDPEYGGLGLSTRTYAQIIARISRVWMSVSGIINSHLILAMLVQRNGTPEQKSKYLPKFATGEWRGGIGLTEPDCGTDLQAIRTTAKRVGDEYVVNGNKTWITNSKHGNTLALLVKTDTTAQPRHRGMSLLLVQKGPGFEVSRQLEKLGYKGIDTCELSFNGYHVSTDALIGGVEGKGLQQILGGLELGRINVAARGVGVAQAALDESVSYSQQRKTFGKPICEHQAIQLKLGEMATRVEAGRLLVDAAAQKYDRGERCDMEAGMAKYFATEAALENSIEAMRIHGAYGYSKEYNVERLYRDTAAPHHRRRHQRDAAHHHREAADRTESGMSLPLSGVRVLAIEQYGAGPFATQHLADLGAEIIKIEHPTNGGDVGRAVGPYFFGDGDSHFFEAFNRNKCSLTLDLKKPEARAVLLDLVAKSDAVFNNLRGDLPAKLGLTYEQLCEANPKIVCGHLSAYGRTGSRAAWPGYDYLMQAEAGYLSVTGEPDSPPARFGLSIIDLMTGTTAAMALLAGLVDAKTSGKGRDIDVSLFDVALHNLAYVATWYLNGGVVTGRENRSSHPSLTPSQLYKTQDGWIFLMCNKEKFWGVLAEVLDKPSWVTDPRFCNFQARLANRELVQTELDAVLSGATTAQWLERFGGRVPAAPVFNVKEALENPFVAERECVVNAVHPRFGTVRGVAAPVRIDEPLPTRAAPDLGQDTQRLLDELGYGAERIALLREAGVVQ